MNAERLLAMSQNRTAMLVLACFIFIGWFLFGAPFPGRYQITGGGSQQGITMVDTMTGKIRIFTISRKGSFHPSEGSLEIVELTN